MAVDVTSHPIPQGVGRAKASQRRPETCIPYSPHHSYVLQTESTTRRELSRNDGEARLELPGTAHVGWVLPIVI